MIGDAYIIVYLIRKSEFSMPIMMLVALVMMVVGVGYSGCSLWRIVPEAWGWWRLLPLGLWVLPLGLMMIQMSLHLIPEWAESFVYRMWTSWLMIMLYVVMLFTLLHLSAWLLPALRPWLRDSLGGSLVIVAVLTTLFVYANAKYHAKERVALEVKIAKPLERSLRLVALSDLHLGHTIGRQELAKWVEMINAEQPDLILIAGDLIDGDVRPLVRDSVYDELNNLQARLGVYASLGNHEYIDGESDRRTFLSRTNIRLLRDEVELVDGAVYIVGRDDRSNPHRKALNELVAGLDASKPIILLDHQPYHLEQAEQAGVDLQFSGHTHAGQVFPINLVVRRMYEKAHGYHRRGQTHYYISSGLGIWGGKFRIGTQSEYVVLDLSSSSPSK